MRAWYRLVRVAFRLIGLLAALVLLAATISSTSARGEIAGC